MALGVFAGQSIGPWVSPKRNAGVNVDRSGPSLAIAARSGAKFQAHEYKVLPWTERHQLPERVGSSLKD